MKARALLACAFVVGTVIGAPTGSRAAQTIVGTWDTPGETCMTAGGMITIGPRSLTADEMACKFRDVSRSGEVVTWHGTCSDGLTETPTTVVATLRGRWLTFTMNGGHNGPYQRCTPL